MTVYRNVILTVKMEEADNSLAEMDSPYLYLTVSSLINSPREGSEGGGGGGLSRECVLRIPSES